MILVLLGTFLTDFKRPLVALEKLCADGTITEEVIVQTGYTVVEDNPWMTFKPFFKPDELVDLHKRARIIITHAGAASLMTAIKLKKKVIAIARLAKYHEHVDDHQAEILEEFAALEYIIPWRENAELAEVLREAESFTPRDFVSSRSQIVDYLIDYVDSL